jgi:hypothetical protein
MIVTSPEQIKTQITNILPSLPKEDVAHFIDEATRPENANMTSEALLNMLVADPRIANLLAQMKQQSQSGGVNLGNGTSVGQMGDAVAGDKIDGDAVTGDKIDASGSQGTVASVSGSLTQIYINDSKASIDINDLKALIELLRGGGVAPVAPPPPSVPPAEPRHIAIDRYMRQFSDTFKLLTPQGPKYDFPLTFQLVSDNGEPIEASAGTPIDQLITRAQSSRKVILRGAAGSGKTTAMRRTAALIGQQGYTTIMPLYIELRKLEPDALQRVSESLEAVASAESYLEPLLKTAYGQPNMDTLKRLGDYADAKADNLLMVMVDGLNEIYGEEAASSILHRLDTYIQARSSACVIVSDRITPRDAITQFWQVARIERIPLPVIFDQFKANKIDAIYKELTDNDRTLLQTAYFLNYALEHNTARLSSAAEAIAAFFEELGKEPGRELGFASDDIDLLAKAAFDAYKQHRSPKFDIQPFAQAIGQAMFDKLEDDGVVTRLPADAHPAPNQPPSAPQAQFDHPLKHDYLAARYLSQHTTEWTPESLDIVSFESNSFDALAMTLELLPDESQSDTFIQRVHNWNWAAALVCIAKAMRTGSGRHSKEIQLAVLALVAEKMFDPVQQTRKRANEVLSLFPQEIAAPYIQVRNLNELYALVQQQVQSEARFQDRELWFPQWRDLFVRFDSPTFGERDLKQIVSNQAILGWTAANVFRRFKLSDLDVRQLRAYYDATSACDFNDWRASTIRSRVVHAVGATDTSAVVDLLFEALNQDSYLWARIGAARSLVEIAALTADVDLRQRVINTLSGMVTNADSSILALKTLHEIGQSAFYNDAHAGWQHAITPLIMLVQDRQNDLEKSWWSNLMTEFEQFSQMPAALSVG